MEYLKPSLALLGPAFVVILGDSTGSSDQPGEMGTQKPFDIPAGLDD